MVASGVLQRMSRQDLRADNRQFDEQGAFIDFGGGWLSVPVGGLGLVAYAYQPVLRLEDNAYSRGVGTPSLDFTRVVLCSSRMMSMQSSTHSSQMNTVGPAISLRTSCWLFPQNEQ